MSKSEDTEAKGAAKPDMDTDEPEVGLMDLMDPFYMTELHIPIRRHHNTFDDFFMNRFQDMSDFMGADMSSKLATWERRLDNMKKDFFDFSPFEDSPISFDTSKMVTVSPTGKPEFSVQFDIKNFKPEEVKVTTRNGKLEIAGHHEESSDTGSSRREFRRSLDLPKDVQVGLLKSVLSKDGILSITAPIRSPPTERQNAISNSGSDKGQLVVRGMSSHGEALNYSMNVAGYMPQEVAVKVDGNKVKVHAKHDEIARGKKTHNEMTETFDLPPSVDPHHVRCYINNDTLYIEAYLRDDLVGKTHVVPVDHQF